MAKLINVCSLILTCTFAGLTQESQGNKSVQSKPDLSGTWMLDRDQSNVGKPSKPDTPVKISHREPELRITHTFESDGQILVREFVYYTDGRGETNPATILLTDRPKDLKPADIEKEITKSRTRWSGNKLVTRAIIRSVVGSHMVEYELIDEWKLSADGKTLTQTSRVVFQQSSLPNSIYVPSGAPDTRRVYSRIGN